MSNAGHFYLSGSGTGALSWDGAALSITGAITATSGSITGNFTVGAELRVHTSGSLYSGAASTWQSAGFQLQYNSGSGTPRLYVGDGGVTASDKYFLWDGTNLEWRGASTSLTAAGLFTANNANITGTIDAADGYLGNMTVDGTLPVGTSGVLRSGIDSLRHWHGLVHGLQQQFAALP